MQNVLRRPFAYLAAFLACTVAGLTSGCVSGGYKLTRQYATFVNGQQVIVRVLLYIFTLFIFGITLIVDDIIFNTMDFWKGTVSENTYKFNKDDKTYVVQHEFVGPALLKRSTIKTFDSHMKQLQEVVLNETANHQIEFYVDGKLRVRADSLDALPMISVFDAKGQLEQTQFMFTPAQVVAR